VSGGLFGSGQAGTWATGDFTSDGLVDILDIAEFASAALFNQPGYLPGRAVPAASVAAVPEPGTTSIGLLAAIGWLASKFICRPRAQ